MYSADVNLERCKMGINPIKTWGKGVILHHFDYLYFCNDSFTVFETGDEVNAQLQLNNTWHGKGYK